ncbi:MAG: energy-coupling factor ABC transporter ATP-binding protein [Methanomassiliicoccales archaeon]|nr:energy-coupling factor ABC transporter ATP-binding protein [Methanomassiliicoccales archaeon]MDD1755963.1 energy-coupling factor ABC transporter ATP-binding protein [Methanomassiliicoccales archaeon]
MIALESLGYEYEDGHAALRDVNLKVKEGERVALVGPNGAGKSTLMHILAGLFIPSRGKVSIMGAALSKKDVAAARKHVGLLFQDPDDQIFMPTVREDVAFGPMNLGLSKEEVESRVERAMGLTSISSYRDRAPHHLSLGEKKRVAMAGLLAMSPSILLLDEPTANLDPQSRRELVNILDSRRETILIATHDMSAAFHLADRIVVLKNAVLYDGEIPGLLRDPGILQEARLELPSFSRLMQSWAAETGKRFEPPATVEEALDILRHNYCCRGQGDGHSH